MAQGGELYEEGWLAYIVYITSGRRTVRLGLLQGLYERFLIGNLIRYLSVEEGNFVLEYNFVQKKIFCANYCSLIYHRGG